MENLIRIVFEIELRDCLKFQDCMNDITRSTTDLMEWVATDTIEVWCEDLAEEIEWKLEEWGISFTKNEI